MLGNLIIFHLRLNCQMIHFFFVKEKESNLNITLTNKGGLLNFDTIFKASDLASFLPNLNKVNNLLNIIFSNQNE